MGAIILGISKVQKQNDARQFSDLQRKAENCKKGTYPSFYK